MSAGVVEVVWWVAIIAFGLLLLVAAMWGAWELDEWAARRRSRRFDAHAGQAIAVTRATHPSARRVGPEDQPDVMESIAALAAEFARSREAGS